MQERKRNKAQRIYKKEMTMAENAYAEAIAQAGKSLAAAKALCLETFDKATR